MTKDKKGADTSLMVGGKTVPVSAGVASPPPEKMSPKEVLESIDDHENRIDALEEVAFGDVKEKLEEMLKGVAGNFNGRLEALEESATGDATEKIQAMVTEKLDTFLKDATKKLEDVLTRLVSLEKTKK